MKRGLKKKRPYSAPSVRELNLKQAKQFVMEHTNFSDQEATDLLDSVRYYVSNWRNHQDPDKREFSFDDNPQAALPCDTREKAERLRLALNRAEIEVPLLKGGTHVCRGFQVEELPSKRPQAKTDFVVYFRVPCPIAVSPRV